MAGKAKATRKGNVELTGKIGADLSDLNKAIQGHLAQTSIGAAALRNQGAPIIAQTRAYLTKSIVLQDLAEALASEELPHVPGGT